MAPKKFSKYGCVEDFLVCECQLNFEVLCIMYYVKGPQYSCSTLQSVLLPKCYIRKAGISITGVNIIQPSGYHLRQQHIFSIPQKRLT